MASAFSHGLVAIAIGKLLRMSPVSIRFVVLSIFCSVIPDIDIIGYRMGIDYGDLFGHRGITHSLAFAVVFSVAVVRLGFPAVKFFSGGWWVFIFHFFLVTASHGVLDAMRPCAQIQRNESDGFPGPLGEYENGYAAYHHGYEHGCAPLRIGLHAKPGFHRGR